MSDQPTDSSGPAKTLAEMVINELPTEFDKDGNPLTNFDPATILIIIKVAENLIPIIQDRCDLNAEKIHEQAQAVARPRSGGFLARRRRKRQRAYVRLEMVEMLGGKSAYYDAGGEPLLDACISCCAKPDSVPLMGSILST